ncbi:syntaxin binding protein 1 [Spiromyces aspiralis]|uniref:Syntaxin binding protein 1 n=1 Tax=Spiromyces aspiralis TaxID=68401 RepID=A0ACC1HGP5_9FUNG|nr:syntaxin binding protein 1 [Spiromyces aspiralis]
MLQRSEPERKQRGKLIIFMAAGATYSEVRSVYELSEELPFDVYLGSTHLTTPREFLHDLQTLRRVMTQPGDGNQPPQLLLHQLDAPQSPGSSQANSSTKFTPQSPANNARLG